jgi:hypothetical protein
LLLLLGFEREDAIDAAHAGCEALDDGEIGAVVAAGEALSLSRHSGLAALATALSVSESPAAQAIGLSALSAAGGVAAELIAQLLDDDRAVVRRAAVWCCERAPIDARKKLIYPLQRSLDREECWPAARQLAVWGDPSGLARIDALGWRGVDMLTLCGTSTDLMHIDGILKRCERSPALLESVGRLGSPRAIDWLLRQLASGELAEHAARALAVMLGPIVAERDARLDASAWRAAIALLELDGDRYRGGSVWSAAAVADECERGVAAGELSRIDLERRCDELRARLGTPNEQTLDAIDLWRWHAAADQQLAGFLAAARTAGA